MNDKNHGQFGVKYKFGWSLWKIFVLIYLQNTRICEKRYIGKDQVKNSRRS